ncbi:MAG: histidine--tRNA ligase [Nanoarchaeota archaeon]|nr:histidine--tRNA ligase [Nanoarchaeota archaeon]MBU1269246.1 histidine--tRNA ligase [Nanoarchaeota archaeon]MBU1604932.1 histidine--tRNA ligase [Nanoarchaeota archaeon]MBU2443499.1 histidine--tRNA ligase [Nanoarchaeota archaeon]
MKLMTARGVRDFPPEDKILRNELVDKLKRVFEVYGYSPLETPIIERYEVLFAKAGAGQEADATKETFTFKDQGDRDIGLRFELTLSFARFIGMNPNMKMPFKRYEFGPVFRDGPIKLGRYRQFWQCDVDIVGCKTGAVDAEIVALVLDVFKELGLDAYIEVNNRKILKGIIKFAGIKQSLADSVIISIDKLSKLGADDVRKELEQKGVEDTQVAKLLSLFDLRGTNEEKLSSLKSVIKNDIGVEGLFELEELFSYLSAEQKKNVVFNVSLARGLGYYTGTIYEGFVRNSEVTSSICGGGRYDDMVSQLLGSDKEYPCTGISFGLDVITDVLKLLKIKAVKTVTGVYVIPIKTSKDCFKICQELRSAGVSVDMDLSSKGISKNLDYANSLGIPFVVFVGERELRQGKVKLRDMVSGKEDFLSVKALVKRLKNNK